ncbi:ABC transporter substrate-binding protein [uncultured Roseibium sp.]|uniref:substrate-binding periplasmic protein n=1 Tax=uncultured Roseibium sp. TaxID=1936171 RepID=UPI00262B2414|nr:ABC transporter substrate-binding protein [uncultured Roseibium sp.]
MKKALLFGLLFALGFSEGRTADADSLTVTTLEWPPYTSEVLPKGGATTEVVRQAFAAVETDINVAILPWKRAISLAKDDANAIAYFPGYHCRHVDGFIASDPIGNGPLGFAENVKAPVVWNDVDDIGEQKLKVGTVLGYANTDEFDEKAGTGWIRAIPAPDDITNLRKLARQRIDVAVIDKLVLSYLLATEDSLEGLTDTLVFNERPLEDKTLYLCFNDNDAGRALRDKFNDGLAQIDVDLIVEKYFENEF